MTVGRRLSQRPSLLKEATSFELVQGLLQRKTVLGAATHALHVIYSVLQTAGSVLMALASCQQTKAKNQVVEGVKTVLQNFEFWALGNTAKHMGNVTVGRWAPWKAAATSDLNRLTAVLALPWATQPFQASWTSNVGPQPVFFLGNPHSDDFHYQLLW